MVTRNDIRNYLSLPPKTDFIIKQVDSLGANDNTLMFINKPDVDLFKLDESCQDCVILLEKDLGYNYYTARNDFIMIDNAKYIFSLLVYEFCIPSKLQREYVEEYYPLSFNKCTEVCREIKLGTNIHVDSNTIIGGTDFSPVLSNNPGELIQFPQMGGVKLGNNVVVKYNTMIGKGTFGYTEIGDYTMIDYGCQIGHNCIIGKSCIIAAGTIIGGSTTVGDGTVIGIGAKIRNGLKIGKNVSIGMGSVVIRDIPDNCVVVGNPARIIEHKHIFDKEGLK